MREIVCETAESDEREEIGCWEDHRARMTNEVVDGNGVELFALLRWLCSKVRVLIWLYDILKEILLVYSKRRNFCYLCLFRSGQLNLLRWEILIDRWCWYLWMKSGIEIWNGYGMDMETIFLNGSGKNISWFFLRPIRWRVLRPLLLVKHFNGKI